MLSYMKMSIKLLQQKLVAQGIFTFDQRDCLNFFKYFHPFPCVCGWGVVIDMQSTNRSGPHLEWK
jgi:hypothetical protein